MTAARVLMEALLGFVALAAVLAPFYVLAGVIER